MSHGSVHIEASVLSSLASRQHVETLGLASSGEWVVGWVGVVSNGEWVGVASVLSSLASRQHVETLGLASNGEWVVGWVGVVSNGEWVVGWVGVVSHAPTLLTIGCAGLFLYQMSPSTFVRLLNSKVYTRTQRREGGHRGGREGTEEGERAQRREGGNRGGREGTEEGGRAQRR